MKNTIQVMLLLVQIIFLSACSTQDEKWSSLNCNQESAYGRGYNDAKEDDEYDLDFVQRCTTETQELARKAYFEGFKSGGGKSETEEYKHGQDLILDLTHAIKKNSEKTEAEADGKKFDSKTSKSQDAKLKKEPKAKQGN